MSVVHTIGHSKRDPKTFLALLVEHGLTAVADVRSQPYSRFNPQFNRESLAKFLQENGIAYVFLGQELGARTPDQNCYIGGKLQYDRLALTASFQDGLARIEKGVQKYPIALMCAEREPLACHRSILIARHLIARGIRVRHIVDSNLTEDHESSLSRLISLLGMDDMRMFPRTELIDLAYQTQGARIAFERYKLEDQLKRESA